MSAIATDHGPSGPDRAATGLDVSGTTPVPFSRLARVELRKMLDTRGGFWLLLLTVVLLVLTTAVVLLVTALSEATGAPDLMDWVQILSLPLSLLLPVFPILSVTSEWGQRTALVTFSLEPNRIKVLCAKLAAVVALAAGTIVVAGILGLVATPVAAALDGSSPVWDVDRSMLGFTLLVQLLYFMMAFALGAALLNSPGAISAFYVMGLLVPMMVYSTLYALFTWAQDVIPWIDLQYASSPFVAGMETDGTDAARLVVASALWIVVPLAFGVRRLQRTEVK